MGTAMVLDRYGRKNEYKRIKKDLGMNAWQPSSVSFVALERDCLHWPWTQLFVPAISAYEYFFSSLEISLCNHDRY